MQEYPQPLSDLIAHLASLPGIGKKTARRLAFHLMEIPKEEALDFANSLAVAREKIGYCSQCFNLTDQDPCPICQSAYRKKTEICIVEAPSDVASIERMQEFHGLYHVLHGVLSPKQTGGLASLHLHELADRLVAIEAEQGVSPQEIELILATNPNTDGEVTANFIAEIFAPQGYRCTRIATGIPSGGSLEYSDEVSLAQSLKQRRSWRSSS